MNKRLALLAATLLAACTMSGCVTVPVTEPVLGPTGTPVLNDDGTPKVTPVLKADGTPKTKFVFSAEKAPEAAAAIAPFIPPPFDLLAGPIAALIVAGASLRKKG